MKKKEQFSIALWDRLQKENIPHRFETRSGDDVTQLHKFEGEFIFSIYGVHNGDSRDSIECWMDNGLYNTSIGNLDLFIVFDSIPYTKGEGLGDGK